MGKTRIEGSLLALTLGVVAVKAVLSATSLAAYNVTTPVTSWVSVNLLGSLLILVPLTLWAVTRARFGSGPVRFTYLEIPLLILATLCILSMRWTSNPAGALALGADLFWISATLFLLGQLAGPDLVRRFLFSLCIFGLLLGITQYFFLFDAEAVEAARKRMTETGASRVAMKQTMSMFLYTNHFGAMLVLAIGLFVGAFVDSPRHRWVPAVGLAAAMLMLLQTGSRAAVASLLLAACAVSAVVLVPRRSRLVLIPLAAAVGLVGLALFALWGSSRAGMWSTAFQGGLRSPLIGVGAAGYRDAYATWRAPSDFLGGFAFNDYLQTFCELGLLGLAALVAFWFVGLKRRPGPGPTEESLDVRLPGAVAIAAGLLIGLLIGGHLPNYSGVMISGSGAFKPLGFAALAMCVATAAFAFARLPRGGIGGRHALWAGALGFATHMLFDFDLPQTNLFLLGALALLGTRLFAIPPRTVTVSAPAFWGIGTVAGGLCASLLAFVVLPWIEADGLKSRGPAHPESLLKAASLSPLDPEPWDRLARLRVASGNTEGALAALLRSAAIRPTSMTWLNIGKIQAIRGNLEAALTAYARAEELEPSRPVIHVRKAELLVRQGLAAEALKAYRTALQIHETTHRSGPRLPPKLHAQVVERVQILSAPRK